MSPRYMHLMAASDETASSERSEHLIRGLWGPLGCCGPAATPVYNTTSVGPSCRLLSAANSPVKPWTADLSHRTVAQVQGDGWRAQTPETSGFRPCVTEAFVLLECYAVYVGSGQIVTSMTCVTPQKSESLSDRVFLVCLTQNMMAPQSSSTSVTVYKSVHHHTSQDFTLQHRYDGCPYHNFRVSLPHELRVLPPTPNHKYAKIMTVLTIISLGKLTKFRLQ